MDRDKFNSKLLDIRNLLDDIDDWISDVYDENFEKFRENRDLVRKLNDCRNYILFGFLIGLLLWFLFSFLM